mmetsp:Transcript_22440/g.34235  ORF Transcript_22440/g.34235 Transcript_22440/m.34235 type:complete len:93 (+) Transcript_22440:602-880(+)
MQTSNSPSLQLIFIIHLNSNHKDCSNGISSFLIARFVDCIRHELIQSDIYQVKIDAMRDDDAGLLLAMANGISGFVAMNPKGIENAGSNGNA